MTIHQTHSLPKPLRNCGTKLEKLGIGFESLSFQKCSSLFEALKIWFWARMSQGGVFLSGLCHAA